MNVIGRVWCFFGLHLWKSAGLATKTNGELLECVHCHVQKWTKL
jgi:hypothetical protein